MLWYHGPPGALVVGGRCVAALLAAQADMERGEAKLGRTALHVATSEGHAAVVEQLLSAGANFRATFSKLKVRACLRHGPRRFGTPLFGSPAAGREALRRERDE